MDARRRKLIIIGGVLVSALLVGVVTILILKFHNGDLLCLPANYLPEFDPVRIRNLASKDNTSLVGLYAYLQLNTGEDSQQFYSDLSNIEAVVVDLDDRNRPRLKLNETCSQVMFKFDKIDNQTNHIWSIEVRPSDRSEAKACATKDTGIYFKQDQGYNCFSKMKFPCYELKRDSKEQPHANDKLSDTKVGDLVFEALRFEIGGDPSQIAKGQFSKQPHYCF